MQNKIEDIEKRIKKIKDIIKANESVVNQIKDEKYMSKKETAQKHSIDDLVDKNMDFDFINELKKTIAINNKLRLVFI
ncbi:MAG: hypothetical protein U9Q66_02160 [Patescibacteria group bacterium]|nr:hypothetical protein [Patescibacteria group bacterium]